MTVLGPTLERCPKCESTHLQGDMRVSHDVFLDGEGGIEDICKAEDSQAFESLRCGECEHILIQDGTVVDESIDHMGIV